MQIKKRLLVGGVCGALLIGTMVPALAATVHYNDGSTVGGSALVKLKKATRVAVVPVGYQNGLGVERPREAGLFSFLGAWRRSRRQYLRIGEQKARVIGQPGAIETLVDVTNLKCAPGDMAVFQVDPLYARGLQRVYR